MDKSIAQRLEAGEKALQIHDIDTAIHEYRSILDSEPKNVDALLGLMNTYLFCHDLERVESYLDEALAVDPENPVILCKAGYLYESMDDFVNARLKYEKAYAKEKNNPEINAAMERLKYLHDGEEMKLSDGTYIGEHTDIKPQKLSNIIFTSSRDLVKLMRQFYQHIGKEFEESVIYKFLSLKKRYALFLLTSGIMMAVVSMLACPSRSAIL